MVRLMSIHKVHQQRGFTLIEVLIAISILTLVVAGVIQFSQQRIRTLSYVEEKLAATQVANNLLQEYRLTGSPLEPVESSGDVVMGHWQFNWQRKVEAQSNQRRYRIVIKIFLDDYLIQDRVWYKSQ